MLAHLGLKARYQPGSGFLDPLEVPSNIGSCKPVLAGEETEAQREARVLEITKLARSHASREGRSRGFERQDRVVGNGLKDSDWAPIQAPLLMICRLPGLNFIPVKWTQ